MSHYILYVSLRSVCLITYSMSHYVLYVSLRIVCLAQFTATHDSVKSEWLNVLVASSWLHYSEITGVFQKFYDKSS